MDADLARGLAERRKGGLEGGDEKSEEVKEGVQIKGDAEGGEGSEQAEEGAQAGGDAGGVEGGRHRRLQEVGVGDSEGAESQEEAADGGHDDAMPEEEDFRDGFDDYGWQEEPEPYDDAAGAPPDGTDEAAAEGNWGDDHVGNVDGEYVGHLGGDAADAPEGGLDADMDAGMDDWGHGHGYEDYRYGRRGEAPEGWDSHEQYQEAHDKYFHDSNYLRLPPHLLSSCALAELPRAYVATSAKAEDGVDELVLCAVSYYFDEDECRKGGRGGPPGPRGAVGKSFGKHANADGGDETEEQRGRYVANAILGYNLRWKVSGAFSRYTAKTRHSFCTDFLCNFSNASSLFSLADSTGRFKKYWTCPRTGRRRWVTS